MKKLIVLAMAAITFAACSKESGSQDTRKEQLHVLTSIGSRATVDGAGLPLKSAIGVHVVKKTDPTAIYTAATGTAGVGNNLADGQNVRFVNLTNVNTWLSLNKDDATDNKLIMSSEIGIAYAYYPYVDAVTGIGDAATIPATLQASGTIDASVLKAKKEADYAAGAVVAETDYLYEYSTDAGNGNALKRPEVSAATTTTAKLSMKHAMARISFLVYAGASAPALTGLSDANYYLMGYQLKNASGKSVLHAQFSGATMKIADGTIAGTQSGGVIERTISNYPMQRAASESTADINTAKGDSKVVGNLVFPVTTAFTTASVDGKTVVDGLELVIKLKKSTDGEDLTYTIPIPVESTSTKWEPGKHYLYTVKLSGANLSVETITVEKWTDVVGGDIEIH